MSSSNREEPWIIVKVMIIVALLVGGGGYGFYELSSNINKAAAFKTDIKQRCKPVYITLEKNNLTSIYTCLDETQYEFTERI